MQEEIFGVLRELFDMRGSYCVNNGAGKAADGIGTFSDLSLVVPSNLSTPKAPKGSLRGGPQHPKWLIQPMIETIHQRRRLT